MNGYETHQRNVHHRSVVDALGLSVLNNGPPYTNSPPYLRRTASVRETRDVSRCTPPCLVDFASSRAHRNH